MTVVPHTVNRYCQDALRALSILAVAQQTLFNADPTLCVGGTRLGADGRTVIPTILRRLKTESWINVMKKMHPRYDLL